MKTLFLNGAFANAPTLRALEESGFDFSIIPTMVLFFFAASVATAIVLGLAKAYVAYKLFAKDKNKLEAETYQAQIKSVAELKEAQAKEKAVITNAMFGTILRAAQLTPEQVLAAKDELNRMTHKSSKEIAKDYLDDIQHINDMDINRLINDAYADADDEDELKEKTEN